MYGNAEKAKWRHDVWKAASLAAKTQDNWVLTLAGRRFLDRKIAPQYGFDQNKIIGVDTNKSVEKNNTKHGRTVINRDMGHVLRHWSRPVSAINLDYCSNINLENNQHGPLADLLDILEIDVFRGAAIILNVAKGRETGKTNYFLKMAGCFSEKKQRKEESKREKIIRTNRAIFVVQHAVTITMCAYLAIHQGVNKMSADLFEKSAHLCREKSLYPVFVTAGSYVAHKQPMDWAVFRVPDLPYMARHNPSKCGHITAKLAHHTMRTSNA